MALKRAVVFRGDSSTEFRDFHLFGGGVLGDCFGTLGDGVLGEFTWQQQSDGGLYLATGDGRLLVVVSKSGCLGSDALEDVVHEAVHDGHGTAGNTGVGVDLLHDLVDVNAVGLASPLSPLLVPWGTGCLGHCGLLGSLSWCFRTHDDKLWFE